MSGYALDASAARQLGADLQMAESAKEQFQKYIDSTFPADGKRNRSAVIRESFSQRIVAYLNGTPDADKAFRHFVKKTGFQLLDLPSTATEVAPEGGGVLDRQPLVWGSLRLAPTKNGGENWVCATRD